MNLSTPAHSYDDLCSEIVNEIQYIEVGYLVYLKGKIIGWGVVVKDQYMIFVHRKFRNQGAGTKLVKRLTKEYPNKLFCPWNRRVQGFFNKRKVTYTRRYLPF